MKDLFIISDVRKNTVIMFIYWIATCLGFYGINLGAGNLGHT